MNGPPKEQSVWCCLLSGARQASVFDKIVKMVSAVKKMMTFCNKCKGELGSMLAARDNFCLPTGAKSLFHGKDAHNLFLQLHTLLYDQLSSPLI